MVDVRSAEHRSVRWRHGPPKEIGMADFVYLVIIFAFFGLGVLYVRGCDRLIASADDDANEVDE